MKILNALFTSLAILLLSSCLLEKTIVGNENIINTTYDYSDFNTLELSNSFNIKIIQSTSEKINIKGEAKSANLNFSGASKIAAENFIISENIDIKSSGASHISITTNKNITIDLSGASKCNLYGTGVISKESSSGASKINKQLN